MVQSWGWFNLGVVQSQGWSSLSSCGIFSEDVRLPREYREGTLIVCRAGDLSHTLLDLPPQFTRVTLHFMDGLQIAETLVETAWRQTRGAGAGSL